MPDAEFERPESAMPSAVESDDETESDATAETTETSSTPQSPPRWPNRWQRAIRFRVRIRRRTARHLTEARTIRASAALSGLLAAVLASAGWYVFIGPPPGDAATAMVSDYLEALRDGDADAALTIAGVSTRPDRDDFLTDAAIDTDWRVDSLATVDSGTSTTTVRVRISDDSGRWSRGEFLVSDSPTKPPRIDNPFVNVGANSQHSPGFLDLNGTVAPLADGSDADRILSYPVFPGSYRLYAKSRSLLSVDPGRMVLLPNGSSDADTDDENPAPSHNLDFSFTVTDKAQQVAQRAVTAMIDRCVESDELSPGDCPFTAADSLRSGVLETNEQYFVDVEDLAWKVKEQPKVRLHAESGGRALSLSQRNGTTLTLTGTGNPVFGEDEEREKFTVDCPYDFDTVTVALTASGGLTLTPLDPDRRLNDCHLR